MNGESLINREREDKDRKNKQRQRLCLREVERIGKDRGRQIDRYKQIYIECNTDKNRNKYEQSEMEMEKKKILMKQKRRKNAAMHIEIKSMQVNRYRYWGIYKNK